ncbi:MAG: radical SAM protein [Lachnospiraceae bacterium]|nr:radical SAM protein [Lachnospiraceae bacterium]
MDYDFSDCTLCPRNCHADRTVLSPVSGSNKPTGYCRQSASITAARAALHMWEEPCISGTCGSGTVFFSGCNMGCIFCQNYEIAHGMSGKTISVQRLSEIFLELQGKRAHNINLVTPTHFAPQIIDALVLAKKYGLRIPIVYNTSSYETVDTLRMLDGLVDIYLPDFKYYSSVLSKKYSFAEDYFEKASLAVAEMVRQTGDPVFQSETGAYLSADEYDDKALLLRGTIVRHLLLPGSLDDSKAVVKYLYETYRNRIFLSIMSQYTPLKHVRKYPELNRKVSPRDYESLVDYAVSLGVENGFIQDSDTAAESFIPDFNCEGV